MNWRDERADSVFLIWRPPEWLDSNKNINRYFWFSEVENLRDNRHMNSVVYLYCVQFRRNLSIFRFMLQPFKFHSPSPALLLHTRSSSITPTIRGITKQTESHTVENILWAIKTLTGGIFRRICDFHDLTVSRVWLLRYGTPGGVFCCQPTRAKTIHAPWIHSVIKNRYRTFRQLRKNIFNWMKLHLFRCATHCRSDARAPGLQNER